MSRNESNSNNIQEENHKKFAADTTSDSGFFSGEQTLSGFINSEQQQHQEEGKETINDDKVDSTDMTRKTNTTTTTITGNSPQSKDSENYTDSGIVSCSNIVVSESPSLSKEISLFVPEYLLYSSQKSSAATSSQRLRLQHPTLNIQKYFEQDEDGYTKLHIAILHNIEPAINVLINFAEPALLNIKNFSGQTALHLAVLLGLSNIVRKLINAGADVNIRDNRCNSPLHLAVLNNDQNCVQVITSAIYPPTYGNEKSVIANLEQWNYDGETCFYIASKLRNVSIMKHLIKFGANVNAREGRSGYSSLHYAVETHANDVVKFLCEDCESIVNLDSENYGGFTAFQLCLLTNQNGLADYLVGKGATPYFTPESDYEDDDDDEDDEDIDASISSEFEKNQLVNKIAEIAVN